jgi:hypothetical protein
MISALFSVAAIAISSPSSAFTLETWSYCNTRQGCVDPDGASPLELGDGQFASPTGIAINSTGYVGDWWKWPHWNI